ncbi:hypothetical protein [Paenibacillus dendritiformis]|uniref:hypothetical protein n=1 Tax=Paenibacillus dendritiformis TaxID=130049 RepID=UPI00387E1652
MVFDGDGLNTYNKNNVTNLSKFTVPGEAAGNYMITASIGLDGLDLLTIWLSCIYSKTALKNITRLPTTISNRQSVFEWNHRTPFIGW